MYRYKSRDLQRSIDIFDCTRLKLITTKSDLTRSWVYGTRDQHSCQQPFVNDGSIQSQHLVAFTDYTVIRGNTTRPRRDSLRHFLYVVYVATRDPLWIYNVVSYRVELVANCLLFRTTGQADTKSLLNTRPPL